MNTTTIGNAAEQAVAEYLKPQGYKIIELNWKAKYAEIDIVAERKNVLYFVEVKYRKTNKAGDGFEYITPVKLYHMERAAEAWVITHDWMGEFQLLAAAVWEEAGQYQIEIREIV